MSTLGNPAPRFVLFVGHASHDPKNYLGFGDSDLVPTRLIDTTTMETSSDDWFVDFAEDNQPRIAVGRLPVRTEAEAALAVAKILAYENTQSGAGILLVSDRNTGIDFEAMSDDLAPVLPSGVVVETIARDQADLETVRRQLLLALNRGPALVNYLGHGSVDLWAGRLLTADDARGLSNSQRLSVFILMTCLNGYDHDPALGSLGEALLTAPQGGAVAVWASSGMTAPSSQAVTNQALYRSLWSGRAEGRNPATLGEAILRAKSASGDNDIRRTWTLLGDPALRIQPR